MPKTNFITISQKIEDEKERERLIQIVQNIIPKGMGAIIRTSGIGIGKEDIEKDLKSLIDQWSNIEKLKIRDYKDPRIIYDNLTLLRRTVIDIIDQNLNRIIVNDKEIYSNLNKILNDMNPNKKIEIIFKEDDLFELYDLNIQIEKLEKRKIWLKCGGFITIDRTEALTAIDVNTAKYVGNKSLEQTIFNVNKDATIEIAKQLRLRDIGGIIIIDYIDMQDKENENKILEILSEQLKRDRTKCQVAGFTKLNLLEMTRKNMCNN